jgi:hypothetical protein
MPQKITAAINAQGQLVISGEGVKFELVSVVDPPPVDPPPVDPPVDPPPVPTGHIWVDVATLPSKPRTGRGWNNMYSMAKGSMPVPVTVADQNSMNSAWAHACSYVYAATGDTSFLSKVVNVFKALVSPTLPIDRALALAREIQGYVAAAEGVQLAKVDADLDAALKAKFRYFLTCKTSSGPASLLESHRKRPNNWGTHATAAVMMIARYIGDDAVFADAIRVFRGFLGDWDAYHGFVYGADDWQANKSKPLGINAKDATIEGHNLDGALPEELRRGGSFSWPLPATMPTPYPWEAEQGITAAVAVALNAGVDLRPASDWAHLRSIKWLYDVAHWPAIKDDAWQVPVLNWLYPDLKLSIPDGGPGKGMAWTEFTHQ